MTLEKYDFSAILFVYSDKSVDVEDVSLIFNYKLKKLQKGYLTHCFMRIRIFLIAI